MSVPFEQLPPNARVWIYQANRSFTPQEKIRLTHVLEDFCQSWAAHGQPLKAGFQLAYEHFVVLAVDEAHHLPSGCSIDSSVHVLKGLEAELSLSFFDRTQIAFLVEGGVTLIRQSKLKEAFTHGTLTAESIAFNNLVATKVEWERKWLSAVKDSWLARYLPQASVAS